MTGDQLRAALERNKVPIGAAAAAAVLVVALRARGKLSASPSKPGTTIAPAAAYDSTASDVYNSLQPEIEALQLDWQSSIVDITNRLEQLSATRPPPGMAGGGPALFQDGPASPTPQVAPIVASPAQSLAPWVDPTPVAGYPTAPTGMRSTPIVMQDQLIGVAYVAV